MILALSTSSPWLSAAVGREGLVIADARQESHRRASEELIALVDTVLAAANVELADLSGIVVDVGLVSKLPAFVGHRIRFDRAGWRGGHWGTRESDSCEN
jgi:hypothetical protein